MPDREDFERRIFSYYPPLQRVREYVEKNLSEPISLREAAGAAGLEEKYFSAFFHRKTGICFRDWLAGRRVDRAIEILTQQDDTITSVGSSVGFQDLRTFERTFKRVKGLTPREFKRSVAPETAMPPPIIEPAVIESMEQMALPLPAAKAAEPLPQRAAPASAYAPAPRLGSSLRGLARHELPIFLMAPKTVTRVPAPIPP